MKNILYITMLFLIGCSSARHNSIIPYIVDLKVEKSIYKVISEAKGQIGFYITHLSDSKLMIILNYAENREKSITNRMLFINDSFYPITFDTDYLFYAEIKREKPIFGVGNGVEIDMPIISEREKMEFYDLKKRKPLFDHYTYWIIDKINGKLIETNVSQ